MLKHIVLERNRKIE